MNLVQKKVGYTLLKMSSPKKFCLKFYAFLVFVTTLFRLDRFVTSLRESRDPYMLSRDLRGRGLWL